MGKGGGGKARTPVEAPETGRSKQQVKIVEIISEGEIEGLAEGMKSVYLDKTPIQNADESYNFKNVEIQGRTGLQVQDELDNFDTSEKEISVSVQVKKNNPIVRTITDEKVTRLRLTLGVQSLFKQNNEGDTKPSSVQFSIQIGEQIHDFEMRGKYSSQYLKQYEFDDLPATPFQIRVTRKTADSDSQRLQNNTLWASYTEIIDTEFTYPNTALIGVKFDSEYFNQIPNRTYEIKGIKLKVPSNYDPIKRTYSGFWDGSFKIAWSDNPAWVLYDVMTNKRYGLGKRLGDFNVDKWTLYQVAQYCDQLVPNGFGEQEPRFRCNVWLTEQRKAYDVITDICSIFRALPVWNGKEFTVVMDRPTDPVWTYTNANVVNGEFEYQYSALKSRHNEIHVEYADETDGYEKKIEIVSDDDLIRRYGLNIKKITAFGCTSRGQAHRTGLWTLMTEKLEAKTVTFKVGREGLMHLPGDIIRVSDCDYAATNIGGRVLSINGNTVQLDCPIEITNNSYFTYVDQQLRQRDVKIVSVKGNAVTLASEPVGLIEYGIWSLTTEQITSQLYRAITISEEDNGQYSITALQHEPQKEAIVDNGAHFSPKPTIKSTAIDNVLVEYDGSKLVINGSVSNSGALGSSTATQYDIKILRENVLVSYHKGLKSPNIITDDLPNGNYIAVVIAKNDQGQILSQNSRAFTIDRPPVPQNVSVTGGLSNIIIEWDYVNDITHTEIWASETDDRATAKKITTILGRMYSHEVGARAIRYYWLRHIRGMNIGAFNQDVGLRAESGADIDKELALLNEKLSVNIVNEIIDTALPARNLELIKTVSDLQDKTTFLNHKQVYSEADGKLYVWNGSEYTADSQEVLATAIQGIIQPSQLAAIPTAQLSGQLTDAQISSVSANKIAGVVGVNNLPSVPTTKLSGQISANQIQANAVGANAIQANAIGTNHLQASSVGASQIQANSIGANAIQTNAISADKLQANSVTTAKIQASAVRANHIAAGEVSADKLAVGLGGNLFYNPIFANNANGWGHYIDSTNMNSGGLAINQASGAYQGAGYLPTENQWRWQQNRKNTNAGNVGLGGLYQDLNIIAGEYYCFSAYVASHRAYIQLNVEQLEGTVIKRSWGGAGVTGGYGLSGNGETNRIYMIIKATKSKRVRFIVNFFAYGTENGPMIAVRRPMLEICTQYTKEPSPWQNAGVTSIHGGSIVTNSVTAQQIAARTLTANEIAVGTITGTEIKAKTIGVDKLAVNNLSAISANMGTLTSGSITGGTIRIGNAQKGNQGTWASGATGFYLDSSEFTLRSFDTQGGIVLSSLSKNLTVWEGSTLRVKVGKLS
ncbi:hypothetical protein A4G18_00385 [Pasteurellaceae bacterium Pebbles2]|nr:hypothetical protein [Pasteurellaceae bacterium Pebbles2]